MFYVRLFKWLAPCFPEFRINFFFYIISPSWTTLEKRGFSKHFAARYSTVERKALSEHMKDHVLSLICLILAGNPSVYDSPPLFLCFSPLIWTVFESGREISPPPKELVFWGFLISEALFSHAGKINDRNSIINPLICFVEMKV